MSISDDGGRITSWSELEGQEIKKSIKKAREDGDVKTAEILEAIDSRATSLEKKATKR